MGDVGPFFSFSVSDHCGGKVKKTQVQPPNDKVASLKVTCCDLCREEALHLLGPYQGKQELK